MNNRVTYRMLKEWIEEWNEYNPEMQMFVSVYNDFYHISKQKNGTNIVVEATPGRTWESFTIWKNGYYAGRDSVGGEYRC